MALTEVKQVTNDKSSTEAELRVCEVFHRAVELIGRRWTGAIIQAMLGGARRFSEIRGAIAGISDRLLAERLRELEAEGVLARAVGDGRPPQVLYDLTEKGRGLEPVLDAIAGWAHAWPSG